jgi:hypothetical protein
LLTLQHFLRKVGTVLFSKTIVEAFNFSASIFFLVSGIRLYPVTGDYVVNVGIAVSGVCDTYTQIIALR